MIKESRWLGLHAPAAGVVQEPARDDKSKFVAFGGCTAELASPADADLQVQSGIFLARVAGPISPWVDAKPNAEGQLELPEYDSELPTVNANRWVPGDFTDGVDNVEKNAEGNSIKEWGGMKVSSDPARNDLIVDPTQHPEHIQRLMRVPHMPGQPVKEMWARLKAVEPRLFEDPDFVAVHRDLPENWKSFVPYIKWAESFGINSENSPVEWKGHELACAPAVYLSVRPDTVSICVGIATEPGEGVLETPGAEYDFLEYLYAKDQEGKVIQIQDYKCHGIEKITFAQYSFVPPQGTSSITPYACFKIRGVWSGEKMTWDTDIENPDMKWFTNLPFEERQAMTDQKLELPTEQEGESVKKKKTKKLQPKLWPENSWEGNAAKARAWDVTQ